MSDGGVDELCGPSKSRLISAKRHSKRFEKELLNHYDNFILDNSRSQAKSHLYTRTNGDECDRNEANVQKKTDTRKNTFLGPLSLSMLSPSSFPHNINSTKSSGSKFQSSPCTSQRMYCIPSNVTLTAKKRRKKTDSYARGESLVKKNSAEKRLLQSCKKSLPRDSQLEKNFGEKRWSRASLVEKDFVEEHCSIESQSEKDFVEKRWSRASLVEKDFVEEHWSKESQLEKDFVENRWLQTYRNSRSPLKTDKKSIALKKTGFKSTFSTSSFLNLQIPRMRHQPPHGNKLHDCFDNEIDSNDRPLPLIKVSSDLIKEDQVASEKLNDHFNETRFSAHVRSNLLMDVRMEVVNEDDSMQATLLLSSDRDVSDKVDNATDDINIEENTLNIIDVKQNEILPTDATELRRDRVTEEPLKKSASQFSIMQRIASAILGTNLPDTNSNKSIAKNKMQSMQKEASRELKINVSDTNHNKSMELDKMPSNVKQSKSFTGINQLVLSPEKKVLATSQKQLLQTDKQLHAPKVAANANSETSGAKQNVLPSLLVTSSSGAKLDTLSVSKEQSERNMPLNDISIPKAKSTHTLDNVALSNMSMQKVQNTRATDNAPRSEVSLSKAHSQRSNVNTPMINLMQDRSVLYDSDSYTDDLIKVTQLQNSSKEHASLVSSFQSSLKENILIFVCICLLILLLSYLLRASGHHAPTACSQFRNMRCTGSSRRYRN